MRIIKVFNNNIVAALTKENEEMILTGSGIGFQKKVNDLVDQEKIEKTYEIKNQIKDKLYKILSDTPPKFIKIANLIDNKLNEELSQRLTTKSLIGLIDHITFAVDRKKNNIEIPNLMLDEIKNLYPKEFKVGLFGVEVIKNETGEILSKDEAGYIAMHIVNSGLGDNNENISKIFTFTNGVVNIIKEYCDVDFSKDETEFLRLNTHLKFLAQRILSNKTNKADDVLDLYNMLLKKDKRFKKTVKEIEKFTKKNLDYTLTMQESVYLMVHINKVIN